MKKIIAFLFCLPAVIWANNIAILDQNSALFSTNAAEAENARLQADFGEMDAERQALMQELNRLARQHQNDAAIMSQAEKQELEQKIETSRQRYADLNMRLQQGQQEREQAFINKYSRTLVTAIETIVEQGDFDLVLDASAVIFVKDGYDITQQVIDEFNRLTAD